MSPIHTEFQPYNPFRAPDWRANYIATLLAARPRPKRPSRTRDDRWVHEAYKFLKAWYRFGNDPADSDDRVNRLFPLNPGLFYASMFYGNEDQEYRTLLEANILTRLDDEPIAKSFGTLPDTVYWYERIYFDVRDRLDDWQFIHKAIQGRLGDRAANREGSITQFQRAMMLKTFAYFGGVHMLHFVSTGFVNNMAAPRRSVDARQWAEEAFNNSIARQGLLASTQFETNKFNIISLLQVVQNMVHQEQHIRMTGGVSLEIERNIEKLGEVISIQMATNEEPLLPDLPDGKKPKKGLRELRSAEQLQLAAGRPIAKHHEEMEAELRERLKQKNDIPGH